MNFSGLRIGFSPTCKSSLHSLDLRTFVYYARKRNIKFEIADPNKEYDVVVLTPLSDLSVWIRYRRGNTKVIYMLVDSYLAGSGFSFKGALRGLAKYVTREHRHLKLNYTQSIKDMCRRADAVVCSTLEQKKDIQEYCKNVHIILDFHSNVVRHLKTNYSIGRRVNLVWEGRAENVHAFGQIKEVLIKLRNKYPLSLHIVTDLAYKKYMNKIGEVSTRKEIRRIFGDTFNSNTAVGNDSMVYLHQWNPEMFSRIITGCDIAVIPLDSKSPLMYGKPENKLLLFWRMGMPTVVTATPAYSRAMDKCGLQLYCKDNDEWFEKLEKLIVNENARMFAGLQGKKCVDMSYGEQENLKQWDKLFESVVY